ncbi:branchpoint-bridging protein [Pyrus ussuriensis x Pyrus communis]|uniref:Branchpoint-bridging protein n=1 Tax=Pyrus ussuriensis x Pyrus communis TaxID=2448454 RepID=A0A5N5GD11_9ROSA|nr:leucine-rich repeat extensin-like protein 3 [Pyrus x bretschneideri]KAB2613067.1 branchpoint-bridging protein [Pyrus ussuriensis x Pyrus communis]
MELPFSSLVFVVLWFSISHCTLLVQSQSQNGTVSKPPPPPSSQPLPPLPPPPSPPPPQSSTLSPPPPESPTPPPNPPPLPESPNMPSPSESPLPPDRPPNQISSNNDSKRPPPPPYKGQKPKSGRREHSLPPQRGHKYNAGKKIGLLFVGTASILQIGVIGFLVFKRRQLLKVKDRYGTCS